MRRRTRLLSLASWVGLAICATLVLVWIVNLFVTFEHWSNVDEGIYGSRNIEIYHGQIIINDYRGFGGLGAAVTPRWSVLFLPFWRTDEISMLERVGLGWPHIMEADFCQRTTQIPFWLIVTLPAAMTMLLWRLKKRWKDGHCYSCGYDLTGNMSGICPECGRLIAVKQSKPA